MQNRPNPDSLLKLVNQQEGEASRGRLKVFFGSSAGVGKTFAMLSEARRRLNDGVDVVIGVVETHGRPETVALTEGIPVLPLRESTHGDMTLKEFDLEAALTRKPALILMDEFAHTNAPASLHPKRWQDVEALLAAGIDVYTTLNVQHLESINDMVTKLTGVLVKETVPDHIFDAADDIALIDIPSDELLKRLHDGKVYIAPGASKRAAESFFKKTNLVALRELALRRTAERVDAQMDMLTAAQGMKEAQIGQKILVCVGHDMLSANVIRHARRMANRAKAAWYAMYVETGRHYRLTEKARLAVDRNLRLAEKMGARIVRVSGNNAVDEILSFARGNGFTRLVVGHKQQKMRFLKSSLSEKLVAQGAGLEITTIAEDMPLEHAYQPFWKQFVAKPTSYVYAALVLAACTLFGLPFRDLTDTDNLTMVYLAGVVFIAARLGTGPSIMASVASVLTFNFFFTEPYHTFQFNDNRYYFTFSVMLITSLLVGSLAAKLSLQARQARKRVQEIDRLYALTRELSAARGIPAMAEVAISHLEEAFGAIVAVFIRPPQGGLQIIPEQSPARELKEESVARWVLENGVVAGHNTDTMPSAKGIYFPLIAEKMILGVLGLLPKRDAEAFSLPQISQMETFVSLIASAFQRAAQAEQAESAKIDSEREKLRNVLLSSVSHDLRTPLASITGAASSALLKREELPQETVELLNSIHSQAARLAKLVSNLLDVTSLASGTVKLNAQPYYIDEVIGSALSRVKDIKGNRMMTVSAMPDLPLVSMDGLLIEQVLVNLLENAIRFTRDDGTIAIATKRELGEIIVTVWDDGLGLSPEEEQKIFEKFYTKSNKSDGHAGLGLVICKSIIDLHGGRIEAKNNIAGGTTMLFTLPIGK